MSENPFGVKVQLFLTFEVGTTLEISFISPHPKINKINYRLLFQISNLRFGQRFYDHQIDILKTCIFFIHFGNRFFFRIKL